MQTARTFQRLFNAGRFAKVVDLVAAGRSPAGAFPRQPGPVVAAACILLRLQELGQEHAPFAGVLRTQLTSRQQADGSWGDDVRVTALCVRALARGEAASRGRAALVRVQHEDGAFPALAVRRLPGDAATTLAVVTHLLHLPAGEEPDVDRALAWLETHGEDDRAVALLRSRRRLRAAA